MIKPRLPAIKDLDSVIFLAPWKTRSVGGASYTKAPCGQMRARRLSLRAGFGPGGFLL
jgi:hypothetical protein